MLNVLHRNCVAVCSYVRMQCSSAIIVVVYESVTFGNNSKTLFK